MGIEENRLVRDFIAQFRSKNTRRNYLIGIDRFCAFTGWTPEELVEKAKQDPLAVEVEANKWRELMEEQGLAEYTIYTNLNAVRSFLKFYRCDGVRIRLGTPSVKTFDYIPTPDEVRQLIVRAPLRLKACIALIAYAGMRPSDVLNLRFANVRDEITVEGARYKPLKIPLKIVVKQQKTRQWYCTFLGRLGANILCQYLTEEYTKRGRPWRDEDRLFTYSSIESLSLSLQRIIETCFDKRPEAFKRFRPYSLRKYFRRQVSGILSDAEAEFLMGHVAGLRSLQSVYAGLRDMDSQAIERLRQAYARAMPKLEGTESQVDKIALLKEFAKSLGIEDIEIKVNSMKQAVPEADEAELVGQIIRRELPRILLYMPTTNGNRRKCGVVKEEELPGYIEAGWELKAQLNGGKYLICRDV